MRNHWHSPDAHEPWLLWRLGVSCAGSSRFDVADDVVEAARLSGLARIVSAHAAGVALAASDDAGAWVRLARARGAAEVLPFEDALYGEPGSSVVLRGVVTVRDGDGALVDRETDDVGLLLRDLEVLEPAYAQRFAASHPVLGLWSTTIGADVSFFAAVWCTIFDADDDTGLLARNQGRLLDLRTRWRAIARARGGVLEAPLPRVA